MGKHFLAMSILIMIFRILGWLIAVSSVIIGLLLIISPDFLFYDGTYYFTPEFENGIPLGLTILVVGLLLGVSVIALGESMRVVIKIEKNTRDTRQFLSDLITKQTERDSGTEEFYGPNTQVQDLIDRPPTDI